MRARKLLIIFSCAILFTGLFYFSSFQKDYIWDCGSPGATCTTPVEYRGWPVAIHLKFLEQDFAPRWLFDGMIVNLIFFSIVFFFIERAYRNVLTLKTKRKEKCKEKLKEQQNQSLK